jgi:hypothetical protein
MSETKITNLDLDLSDPSGSPIQPYIEGLEYKTLDVVETNPLLVDNKLVFFKGFQTLTEEEKSRVLLGFLLTSEIDHYNLENTKPTSLIEKHKIHKDNKIFKLKFWGSAVMIGLAIIAILSVIGLFVYMSLQKGVLDENGILTGIMSTLQEVLRILFTDPMSSSSF